MNDNDQADWIDVIDEVLTLTALTAEALLAGWSDTFTPGRPGLRRLIPHVNEQLRLLDQRKRQRRPRRR